MKPGMLLLTSTVAALIAGISGLTFLFKDGEIAQAPEWALLQSLELKYRHEGQTRGLIIEQHALETEYDALGLPMAGTEFGYVWLLANPRTKPKIGRASCRERV